MIYCFRKDFANQNLTTKLDKDLTKIGIATITKLLTNNKF